MSTSELLIDPAGCYLSETDIDWLASFGVDPSWQDDPSVVTKLNELVSLGSFRLNESDNDPRYLEVIAARETFLTYVGIEESILNKFKETSPTLIPLDTFINTQRTINELGLDAVKIINAFPAAIGFAPESVRAKIDNFTELGLDAVKIINASPAAIGLAPESVRAKIDNFTELGLDAVKIINASPAAIGFAPESVRAKIDNFTELGLDAVKIINAFPQAINYAPESVRAKVDNFTELGLDAVKIINASPAAIGLAPESVRAKVDNFTELGLDAVKIINASPAAIGLAPESVRAKVDNFTELGLDAVKIINAFPQAINYAPESVRAKVDNFTELGLDAVKIINAFPSAIGFAPESVRAKVRLLERSAKVLKWEFSIKELIESYPSILGFNNDKIKILRRIAAKHLTEQSREVTVNLLKSTLITPLEEHIIVLAGHPDTVASVGEMTQMSKRIKLTAPERKATALSKVEAGALGRIGTMYLAYRGQ